MSKSNTPERIAQILYEKKAKRIVALSVEHLTILTDYLVIATGNNALQVRGLCDHVQQKMAEEGVFSRRVEGQGEGRWIVMDYNDVFVHIFHPEDRAFYNLEGLWADDNNRLVLPFQEEKDTI